MQLELLFFEIALNLYFVKEGRENYQKLIVLKEKNMAMFDEVFEDFLQRNKKELKNEFEIQLLEHFMT